MLFLAILSSKGEAGKGLYVMNSAEKEPTGREFEEEGAEPLNEGTVPRNICIPVARISDWLGGVRDGPGKLTARPAKAAPLSRSRLLSRISI
jgi:hypothetical protein